MIFWYRRRIYVLQLVLAMTARTITCHDLTTNEADLRKIGELFMTLQTRATPISLLFPWFPTPARKTAKQASTDLYTMLYTYVEIRRHAEPTSDAIDMFIAEGETTQDIVGVSPAQRSREISWILIQSLKFVMGMLFAGVTTTGSVGMSQ